MYWQIAGIYCGTGFIQMVLILGTGMIVSGILHTKTEGVFKRLFYSLCTGIYLWILVTALVFTQGKTVLLGTVPLIALWFWQYRSYEGIISQKSKYSPVQILKYTFIMAGIWVWTSVLNIYCISTDGNSLYLPHFDTLHSIEISQYLQQTGTETYYYWKSHTQTFPYHYAEIWLHAGIQSLWHTQKTWTWQSIVVPLLQTTLVTGLLAVAEQHHKKINLYSIVVACAFLLFQGWLNASLPYFDTHFHFTRYISMIGGTKFIIVGIIFILYQLNINHSQKMLVVLLLPLFSVLTLPAVMVYAFVLWREKRKKILFSALLFLPLWIIAFYVFTGSGQVMNWSFREFLPVPNFFFWKTQMYFILVGVVFYLPLFFWIREKPVLRILFIILTVSYGLFLVFYRWYDSYQFFVLFWIPFIWVYSWLAVIKNENRYQKMMLYTILMLGFIQTVLYKKNFQRTAINNLWVNEVFTYLNKENLSQQGAALWYYDTRQSHIFAWQKKNVSIISLLAKPLVYDGITQKHPSDTLIAGIIQQSLPFQPKDKQDTEEQVFSFCKQNNIRFLVYPQGYAFAERYKGHIMGCFPNGKDKLICIVFKPF